MSASARFFFFFFPFLESVMLITTVLVEDNSDTCALVCALAEFVTVSTFWVPCSGELGVGRLGGGGKLDGTVEFTPPEGADPWK